MPLEAHHILGIPHYAYDEMYPQTPVLTYRVEAGAYDVRITGYPGRPKPGERCTFHVYIKRTETGELFDGTVIASVSMDRALGEDRVVYGPVVARQEERVFKFYPQLKEEADYILRISFEAEGVPWTIDLPMVVGEPGSPWTVLGTVAVGLVAFLVVIRAIRIKRRRRLDGGRTNHGPVTPVDRQQAGLGEEVKA
jgi:hypothetical protein